MTKTSRLAPCPPHPTRLIVFTLLAVLILSACRAPAPTGTPGAATPTTSAGYAVEGSAYPPPQITAPGYPVSTLAPNATPPPAVTPPAYTLHFPLISGPLGSPTPPPPPMSPPPPPTPVWPDPIAGQTASKLGLHVIRNED